MLLLIWVFLLMQCKFFSTFSVHVMSAIRATSQVQLPAAYVN